MRCSYLLHQRHENRDIHGVQGDDGQLRGIEIKHAEPAGGEVGAVEICQPDGAHEHAHDGGVCRHVRVLVDAEERLRLRAVAARGDGVEAARRGEHEPVERAEALPHPRGEATLGDLLNVVPRGVCGEFALDRGDEGRRRAGVGDDRPAQVAHALVPFHWSPSASVKP